MFNIVISTSYLQITTIYDTQPNVNIPNNLSIIDRCVELARENERHPSQINKLLDQLGEPSERAFWVGALINPLLLHWV